MLDFVFAFCEPLPITSAVLNMRETGMANVYCSDCRFFQPSTVGVRFGRCGHSMAARPPNADRFLSRELDAAEPNQFASLMREHYECGHDAKLFEPKTDEAVAA